MNSRILKALAGLACVAIGALAAAQPAPRSFAVYSEVAREINVVTFQESTGSRLSANLVSRVPIPQAALDNVVLLTARQALEQSDRGGRNWLIAPLDSDMFDPLQMPPEGATLKLPDDLAAEMKRRGLSHLLLFTRFRGDANLKSRNATLGSGPLEGLGFYIDRVTPLTRADTREDGAGFLAPFIYVRVTLVDGANGRVLRTRRVGEGHVIANVPGAGGGDPWDVMTPTEKVQRLTDMITREIGALLPEVLAR